MRMRRPVSLVILLNVLAAFASAEPPAGRYSGDGLTLVLSRAGDAYTGSVTLEGKTYDLRATYAAAAGLRGTFRSDGNEFPWTATVADHSLTFQTGGAEYHLTQPAPSEPQNPLAKKTVAANPLAQQPKPTGDNPSTDPAALKFTRLSIKDPGINNIEAVSMLIPEGWKSEGGVQWFPNYSILANLLLTITDPETGAQIQFLPLQNFTWIDNPIVPMQPGSNYMGNIVHRPVASIPDFIREFYTPRVLTELAESPHPAAEDLPRIAEQGSQAYGGAAQVHAARARYDFQKNGAPWQEDVYVTLVSTTNQGFTIWSVTSAYAFRAPKADFDRLSPRMAATIGSIRLSQDWYAGYMYVQQLFMNRMNQGIQNARAISDTVTRNSEEIRKMFADSYKQQSESQDRISRRFSEYIRGVETYTNPYDSRPVELPSGYQSAWVNASGEYILSSQAGFDPNGSSNVEWRRMDQVK